MNSCVERLTLSFRCRLFSPRAPFALSKNLEASIKAKDNNRKLKDTIDDGRHIEQEWSIEGKGDVAISWILRELAASN